ncbi:MAG: ABC transporter ATP-binding protein [Actinomycetaceae bacterium]|nr:ABC transporter ATP-binding protein [Actinomycetaceae bacterium]
MREERAQNIQPKAEYPLELRDVSVVYPDGFRALDSVSFTLEPGFLMSVVGPSGSGKSTLLRAIEGLETLERGVVFMQGRDVTNVPTHKRPCTMVFQDGQLFPHRTVSSNIAYGMAGLGLSRGEISERVETLLKLVDLEGFGERSISTLSGGQAGRVALARSLARQTGLILLDEPLSALDTDLRRSLAKDVREILKASGTAALYVTHDLEEARLLGDGILRVVEGHIEV